MTPCPTAAHSNAPPPKGKHKGEVGRKPQNTQVRKCKVSTKLLSSFSLNTASPHMQPMPPLLLPFLRCSLSGRESPAKLPPSNSQCACAPGVGCWGLQATNVGDTTISHFFPASPLSPDDTFFSLDLDLKTLEIGTRSSCPQDHAEFRCSDPVICSILHSRISQGF